MLWGKEQLNIAEDFFRREESLLADYGQVTGLTIKLGGFVFTTVDGQEQRMGWAFVQEKGVLYYDPEFFTDLGYSRAQAMTATLHELEEVREYVRAPSLFKKEFEREKEMGFRYKVLHNCLQDILINNTLGWRAPVHRRTTGTLYRERMFPEVDYTGEPKHLQFAYAILREAMLPDERVVIDDAVRRRIEQLKDFLGVDLIELIGEPGVEPQLRLEAVKRFVEPLFEELFEEDLQERQQQASGQEGEELGEGQPSEGGIESDKESKEEEDLEKEGEQDEGGDEQEKESDGREGAQVDKEEAGGDQEESRRGETEGEGEDGERQGKAAGLDLMEEEEWFREEYEEFEERLPQPLKEVEMEALVDKLEEMGVDGAGPEDMERRAYELQYGVSWEDAQRYYKEFQVVEPYVRDLRQVFERIINRRIEQKRKLKGRTQRGVILNPGLLVQVKLDMEEERTDSRVWLDYEKRSREVLAAGNFEVTLVCDLSGSMEDPVEKLRVQRQCAILFLEGLAEFCELARERQGEMEELDVLSEVRGFGNFEVELKPLSNQLTEAMRIEVLKNLSRAPGSATWDYESLTAIKQGIDGEQRRKLVSGRVKKAVVVFSDGQSSNVGRAHEEVRELRQMGVEVVGVGVSKHAQAVKSTYKPQGLVCNEVGQLPEILTKLLEEFSQSLGGYKCPS